VKLIALTSAAGAADGHIGAMSARTSERGNAAVLITETFLSRGLRGRKVEQWGITSILWWINPGLTRPRSIADPPGGVRIAMAPLSMVFEDYYVLNAPAVSPCRR
jgi:hypothetical protein